MGSGRPVLAPAWRAVEREQMLRIADEPRFAEFPLRRLPLVLEKHGSKWPEVQVSAACRGPISRLGVGAALKRVRAFAR